MPTYTVTSCNMELSQAQKAAIAELITAAHSSNTGAPRYFAQCIFKTVAGGDHFVGGKPNKQPEIYVLGLIRGGRTTDAKQAVMSEIRNGISAAARIELEDIWVYIQDIPPDQMIEFGRFLPAPGEEVPWQKGFTQIKLGHFTNAGIHF